MPTLRSALIRLAAAHPEFRGDLLPLLGSRTGSEPPSDQDKARASKLFQKWEDNIGEVYDDNMYAEERKEGWDKIQSWKEQFESGDKSLNQIKTEWARFTRDDSESRERARNPDGEDGLGYMYASKKLDR